MTETEQNMVHPPEPDYGQVVLKDTRKVAVIGWDTSVVKGAQASIEAAGEEKRNVDNDGESNLFFPLDYEGTCDVTVKGSDDGEAHGTLHIT
jgi:hypothetical protein